MVNSRQKGKHGELLWRDVLRAAGYTEARRGQQYAGDPSAADVVGGPEGWFAEVKFREQHNPWQYMDEAELDAGKQQRPYVAMKRKNKRWLVTLRAEDFLDLVKTLSLAAAAQKQDGPGTAAVGTPTKQETP